MAKIAYWDDYEAGDEIPSISKVATTKTLVKWAGCYCDWVPIHYDIECTLAFGLKDVIIHGALKRQWLIQLVTDFMGEKGFLKKFICRYHAVDYPRKMKNLTQSQEGETWQCKGKITKKYTEGKDHLLDCEVWLENGNGEKTTTGTAVLVIPCKVN